MGEKIEVRVINIQGNIYINRDDVVQLIRETAEMLPDADARSMVRELAGNIEAGKVK